MLCEVSGAKLAIGFGHEEGVRASYLSSYSCQMKMVLTGGEVTPGGDGTIVHAAHVEDAYNSVASKEDLLTWNDVHLHYF